jgi:hypothetical protein
MVMIWGGQVWWGCFGGEGRRGVDRQDTASVVSQRAGSAPGDLISDHTGAIARFLVGNSLFECRYVIQNGRQVGEAAAARWTRVPRQCPMQSNGAASWDRRRAAFDADRINQSLLWLLVVGFNCSLVQMLAGPPDKAPLAGGPWRQA